MQEDAFTLNLEGVAALINDPTNKVGDNPNLDEGVEGNYEDVLELPMADEELIELKSQWETASAGYYPKIKSRQERNKLYLKGKQRSFDGQVASVVPKNLLFEATATFVPAALAENPEPVVFSDNTDEGKVASNDLKTMLQYHVDVLGMRALLGLMVWQWGEYFVGCVKHGWAPHVDPQTGEDMGDITTDPRKPQNLILDPEGYVDIFGDFHGWLGDRMEHPAEWWIEQYPKHKEYFTLKANGKLGTMMVGTEWWSADDKFTFTTMQDQVLDKHKNEFFNYEEGAPNHFAVPKKPYTFFSVFSLQEEPYDFTNLIEQNIANQDRINDRDEQITKNLASGNNAVVINGQIFNSETAEQAVQTFYDKGFLLDPSGQPDKAVVRIAASPLPSGILETQESDMQSLRSVYGTSGLVPNQNPEEAVRNNIMNEQHDSSRIGGGVGDRLEVTAKNVFNWWTQLYCVFYDAPHYGAIMGNAAAVEYVQLTAQNMLRKYVVSVAPNSMKPHDETSQMNFAIERWGQKAIDPINFLKEIDDADPVQNAQMLVMWLTNPAQYAQVYFGGGQQQGGAPQGIAPAPQQQMQQPTGNAPNGPQAGAVPSPLSAVPIQKL